MKKQVIEKYFDLTKYLLNGWFIVYSGLTLIIMQKYI